MRHVTGILGRHRGINFDKQTCQKLVNDAAGLAGLMRESFVKYDFDFALNESRGDAGSIVFFGDMETFEVFDYATGQKVPKNSEISADRSGRVGKKRAVLYPGLTRQSHRDEEPLVLQKPAIIVRFDTPVKRVAKPKKKASTSFISDLQEIGKTF
jgi:hypothetical protein